ncbi:MAG: hypothetical protein JKY02_02740, partial [Flavobacteriaceae bacterium]|nr:hypothetical protein [Flavobacteriaceae bacterium]
MKKITFLLAFLAIILFNHSTFSQTFDWETGTDNGTNVTQTVSSITATVTTSNNDAQLVNGGGFEGSSGNVIFTQIPDASTSMTITFSQPVDIASIYLFLADGDGGVPTNVLFTPTGGTNSSVVEAIEQTAGEIVTLNWTGVTVVTLTVDGGGFETFGIDDIVLTPQDTTPPIFENSTPSQSLITQTGVTLGT